MISYFRERFKIFPWVFLTLFIPIFTLEMVEVNSILITFIFLLYFRLFDDLECLEWDLSKGKIRKYQNNIEHLKNSQKIMFLILLSGMWVLFKPWSAFNTVFFIGASRFLYKKLENSPNIGLVSILKYPFIVFILEFSFSLPLEFWGVGIFIGLFVLELMEIRNMLTTKQTVLLQICYLIIISTAKGIV